MIKMGYFLQEAIEKGGKAQSARPIDLFFLRIQCCLAVVSFACTVWCVTCLVHGAPIWPFEHHKVPGTN